MLQEMKKLKMNFLRVNKYYFINNKGVMQNIYEKLDSQDLSQAIRERII